MSEAILTQDNDEKKKAGCYVITAFWGFVLVMITKWCWPSLIPFTIFEFWKWDWKVREVLYASWPLLAWATGISTILAALDTKKEEDEDSAEIFLLGGGFISLWAGVVEEICFRWLIFYSEIIGYKFINMLLCGMMAWIHLHISGQVANFFTFGYLENLLFHSQSWAVGAAMISSNGKFRDGHEYQGAFGQINSWFGGMYFFYLMFHFGLPAAIFIHFLYDMIIFFVHYVDAAIGRAQRQAK